MTKREAESSDADENEHKVPKCDEVTNCFVKGTTETTWSPADSDKEYTIRHIHGDTCCESPYADVEDWPTISYSALWSQDEPDEPLYNYVLSVIAAVWEKDSGKFIAFWGADEGDGHVYFYLSKDVKNVEDFEPLSGILSTEICPPLIDVFDDGSGKDREPVMLDPALFEHEILTSIYARKED